MLRLRDLKKQGRKNLKKHYGVLMALCLFAAIIGAEFAGSINVFRTGVSYAPQALEYLHREESSIREKLGAAKTALLERLTEEVAYFDKAQIKTRVADDMGLLDIMDSASDGLISDRLGVYYPGLARLSYYLSTGSFHIKILEAISSILHTKGSFHWVMILASLFLVFLVWLIFTNIVKVLLRRFALESRTYKYLATYRVFFLLRVGRLVRSSLTMMVRSILHFLWSLTIVGYFVKRYSYYLVPMLVAENPDLKPLEAIGLSRRMMNGHKWQCFLYELSFIGWDLLSAATLGLVGIFYSTPYKLMTFTEYYAELRAEFLAKEPAYERLLNDKYLYEFAPTELLEKKYPEAKEVLAEDVDTGKDLPLVIRFFVQGLGIVMRNKERSNAAEAAYAKRMDYQNHVRSLKKEQYPIRLFPMHVRARHKWVKTVNYMRYYSFWNLVLLFFIFCCIGWLWEVATHYVQVGAFANRGFLHGPWLPIYGCGGILILTFLKEFRTIPVMEFLVTMLVAGSAEYLSSYLMEVASGGQRWWDYSGYFLNLNGRICAEGLLIFGIMGIVIVYFVAPFLDHFLRKIPYVLAVVLSLVLLTLLFIDVGISVKNPNSGKGVSKPAPTQVVETNE